MSSSATASLKVTPSARDGLARLVLNLSASLGRRLTHSEVMAAMVRVSEHHQDELTAMIREGLDTQKGR